MVRGGGRNRGIGRDLSGTEKFICNSRARRFGKSVTADMLVAYFSKGADSRELFAPLKCKKKKNSAPALTR